MDFSRPLRIAPLFLLVAACAGDSVQVMNDVSGSYDSSNFGAYHKDRDTRVVILGDTFGLNADDFARRVTGAMQGENMGGDTRFTTVPGASAAKDFRVVLAFNASVSGRNLCATDAVDPARESGVTTLEAVWCWGNSAQSFASARTATVAPSDPRFAALVAAATRDLFPTGIDKKIHESTVDGD